MNTCRIWTLLVLATLIITPAQADGPKKGGEAPGKMTDRVTVGAGITVRNMTVFPILAKADEIARMKGGAEYITLDEGQEAKTVVVKETGTVAILEISNKSEKPLFIMAGEMVTGGKQDRIVAVNVTLAAGKTQKVKVFCVEQGRWTYKKEFNSNKGLVHPKLRGVAQGKKQQSDVWAEVSKGNGKLGTSNPTQTYRFNFINAGVSKALDAYVKPLTKALKEHGRLVGICVAVNGELTGADVYLTPKLYRKFESKLLRSYAIEALTRLPEALEVKDAPAMYDRGLFYLVQGEGKKALADIEAAIRMAPKQAGYHRTHALLLSSAGRTDDALAAYDRALAYEPGNADSLRGRSELLIAKQAWETALIDLHELAKGVPADTDVQLSIAFCLQRQGKSREALVRYGRVLALDGKHAVARYDRGLVLAALGDKKAAMADLQAAVELAPSLAYGNYNRNRQKQQQLGNLAPQQRRGEQQQGEQQLDLQQNKVNQKKLQVLKAAELKKLLEKRIAAAIAKPREASVRRVALRPGLPAKVRTGIARYASAKLAVKAPGTGAASEFLDAASRAPVKQAKAGNYEFESKQIMGFGTGSNRAKLLHFNCHKK